MATDGSVVYLANEDNEIRIFDVITGNIGMFPLSCIGDISALEVVGDYLFIGGQTTKCTNTNTGGSTRTNNIIAYDLTNSTLVELPYSGLNGDVYAMTSHDNTLIVGGDFTDVYYASIRNHNIYLGSSNLPNSHPACAAAYTSLVDCYECRWKIDVENHKPECETTTPYVCDTKMSDQPTGIECGTENYDTCDHLCTVDVGSDYPTATYDVITAFSNNQVFLPIPDGYKTNVSEVAYITDTCTGDDVGRMNGIALFDAALFEWQDVPNMGLRNLRTSNTLSMVSESEVLNNAYSPTYMTITDTVFGPPTAATNADYAYDGVTATTPYTGNAMTFASASAQPTNGVVHVMTWNADNTELFIGGSFIGVYMADITPEVEGWNTVADFDQLPDMMNVGKMTFTDGVASFEGLKHNGVNSGVFFSDSQLDSNDWKSCHTMRFYPLVGDDTTSWVNDINDLSAAVVNSLVMHGDNLYIGGMFKSIFNPVEVASAGDHDTPEVTRSCGTDDPTMASQVSNGAPFYDENVSSHVNLASKCQIPDEAVSDCACEGNANVTVPGYDAHYRLKPIPARAIAMYDGTKFSSPVGFVDADVSIAVVGDELLVAPGSSSMETGNFVFGYETLYNEETDVFDVSTGDVYSFANLMGFNISDSYQPTSTRVRASTNYFTNPVAISADKTFFMSSGYSRGAVERSALVSSCTVGAERKCYAPFNEIGRRPSLDNSMQSTDQVASVAIVTETKRAYFGGQFNRIVTHASVNEDGNDVRTVNESMINFGYLQYNDNMDVNSGELFAAGKGLNSIVNSVAPTRYSTSDDKEHKNDLIAVGGGFVSSYSGETDLDFRALTLMHVALFDPADNSFSPMGSGLDNDVAELIYYEEEQLVFARGSFKYTGDGLVRLPGSVGVYSLETGEWSPIVRSVGKSDIHVSEPSLGTISDFDIEDGYLYIAGEFSYIDGVASGQFARYDIAKKKWSSISVDFDSEYYMSTNMHSVRKSCDYMYNEFLASDKLHLAVLDGDVYFTDETVMGVLSDGEYVFYPRSGSGALLQADRSIGAVWLYGGVHTDTTSSADGMDFGAALFRPGDNQLIGALPMPDSVFGEEGAILAIARMGSPASVLAPLVVLVCACLSLLL